MKPGYRMMTALGLLVSLGGGAACAQILGADFDVQPAGSGGAGGGATTSTTGSTSTTATTSTTTSGDGGGGGNPTCDGRACPEVIADHLDLPWGIALHGSHVYWTVAGEELGAGKVMRAPVAGGPAQTLAGGLNSPSQLFVNDQHVYWTSDIGNGGVERIPIDGSESVEVIVAHQDFPVGIAGDADHLYFTAADGYVRSHPLAVTDPDASVILSDKHASPSVLAFSAGSLYFCEFGADAHVFRLPLDGGKELPLAEHQDHPNGVVVSGQLYFTASITQGTVSQVGVDAGPPSVFAADQNQPAGIAADAQYVYWANYGDGTIRRLKKSGGTPEILATGQKSPNGIAVDDESIYWTNFEIDSAVMKLAK